MSQMKWENLLSRRRYGVSQPEKIEEGRSHFQKDIDRIIFSSSFRRLNHKTQVHPLPQNDNIHTRLPHSLEVSSVGRSLGKKVGERLREELKQIGIEPSDLGDIVQAACLAHDIGNPPFGHSGEEAIRDWFKENLTQPFLQDLSPKQLSDFTNFEGNAQGFRIITKLEYYLLEGGMRLTYATLGTFLKYPWTSDLLLKAGKKKYGCSQSERKILQEIATELGLIEQEKTAWCRHPLAYIMEAADDICYALIDLEDGIEMGFLTYEEVVEILRTVVDFEQISLFHPSCEGDDLRRRKIAIARGRAMNVLIDGIADTFIQQKDYLLNGSFIYNDLIEACGGNVQQCIKLAKSTAQQKIFNNPRKLQLEIGAYAIVEILLDSFIKAAYAFKIHQDGEPFSFKHGRMLELMGSHKPKKSWSLYHAYMHVLDFISGMTDNHATHIAKQLRGMGE
jgi:dGTPase